MKYQLSSEQIASKVAGEMVILNHKKGSYYGLDEVGVVVWDTLEEGPQTLETLCEAVVAAYEVEPEVCLEDVRQLLDELISENLVELAD